MPHKIQPVFDHPEHLDQARFSNPPAIDRGTPFWSWNGQLKKDVLFEQLETFKTMGLGGGHIHPRTGMETEYLSDEFLNLVEACAEKSDELGLLTWLYDEDRWPSGFAGGLAMENKEHWLKRLRVTRHRPKAGESRPIPVHHSPPVPLSEREWVASWALVIQDDLLQSWRRLQSDNEQRKDGEVYLHAYLETAPPTSWFNNTQYIDTLNPEAMAKFIEVTHEKYKERFSNRFGKTIPSIFTDEPMFLSMDRPRSTSDERELFIAWTRDLPETFKQEREKDLLDLFPSVLFKTADGSHLSARWHFHNHHTDRFSQAFAGQIGKWCEQNDLALTGHMMNEPTLSSQTDYIGEAMRSLQHFQLPGIDMLCDSKEYTTAKQAQSTARQNGAPGVLSELYGVTNWDFPFSGHRRQGNWQAALGITTRVHHLTWYQMGGEAKRDYPASMGAHMPWHKEYSLVEDHFARVNVALKAGKPHCRVAMIHPIESFWMVHGSDADELERERLEKGFQDTLNWLLDGLIDVDLISEATLERLSPLEMEKSFTVGEMNYEAIILPPLLGLRSTTVSRLESFIKNGGYVLNTSLEPTHLDGSPTPSNHPWPKWKSCPWEKGVILKSLEPFREITLSKPNGKMSENMVHQLRVLPKGERVLFLCHSEEHNSLMSGILRLKGHWRPQSLNTATGKSSELPCTQSELETILSIDLPIAGHQLIHLLPGKTESSHSPKIPRQEIGRLQGPFGITLSEDNVLLLDRAQWQLNDGPWHPEEEILKVDNLAREDLGMPHRDGSISQPWAEPPTQGKHSITLKYKIRVRESVKPSKLALEDMPNAKIIIDGKELDSTASGYWVDRAFSTIPMPSLGTGDHTLEITWPFGGSQGLEAAYLIGNFGVWVQGTAPEIGAPITQLHWGNATEQGLAFYGGNITYHLPPPPSGASTLQIPHFKGALVTIDQEGERVGSIDRAPWCLTETLHEGKAIDLTCFGTRINTFGQVHLIAPPSYRWFGPQSWRTEGVLWSDNYQLKETGALASPIFLS